MKSIKFIFALTLLLVFYSCEKDEDHCDPLQLELYSLEDIYGCTNTPFQMSLSGDEFQIIQSQQAFEAAVSGDCLPQIDFEQYDLLIGRKGLTQGFDSIEYLIGSNCPDEGYFFNVSITLNATDIAPLIVYHRLTEKLGPSATVNLTLSIQ